MEYFRYMMDKKTYKLMKNGVFCVNKVKNASTSNVIGTIKSVITQDISNAFPEVNKQTINSTIKVAHGGLLEEAASGVLVLGVSFGCKVLSNITNTSKYYRVTGRLGNATDNFNSTGNITLTTPYDHITQTMMESSLKLFEGRIIQSTTSPLIRFSNRPRVVECHQLNLVSFSPPFFTLDVMCGTSFYVRSLVHDLGQALESSACMTDCVRTQQGPFRLGDCLNYEDWTLENILASMMSTKYNHRKIFQYLPEQVSYVYDNVEMTTSPS